MAYIKGEDRNQITLFPEAVDDYIASDNPVRVIEAYVNSLDMQELRFKRSEPSTTGRPAYDPRDLLKLYLYGYLNRIRSSRRLETEAGRNLDLFWLLRKLKPDFKTDKFQYDQEKDIYLCPAGQILYPGRIREEKGVKYQTYKNNRA